MSSIPEVPRIAIIGAGPGGLTLSSLLSKSSIPHTVYDLRSKPSKDLITTPSGSLDLHHESGLLALQACGLYEKFLSLASECSEDMIVADKAGKIRYSDTGDGKRPEIARNALTDLLLSEVKEENFRWEHKIHCVSKSPNAKSWIVDFSHAGQRESLEYDLVIGADGAWSKVRPNITTTKPHFSTINCITLTIPHISSKYPELAEFVGTGSFSALGEGRSVMSQRGSMDSARIYLMISSEKESYFKDVGIEDVAENPELLKEKLLGDGKLYANWGNNLRALVKAGCDAESAAGEAVSAKPLYMLPTDFTWEHKQGLTLIGDAAHLMTPFAGEGVNVAMVDALELSQAIGEGFSRAEDLDEKVKRFEKGMWERMKEVSEGTWDNLVMMFRDEQAPDGMVAFFESHMPPPDAE